MSNFIRKILELLVFIAGWEILIILIKPPAYILPSPLQVFSAFLTNWKIIVNNAGVTFFEAFSGFLIANLISSIIAILIAFHKKLENTIMPIAILIKTMPVVALTPLLIIWFGSGVSSKIATSILICFFPTLVNVLRGIKSLDNNLIGLFKVYSANRKQLTKFLIIPSILPYIFAAMKVSSSLAIIGALVGEFIGSNKGLGFIIMSNYYNMNTACVFAAITTSSIMGISFYYVIQFFEKKYVLESKEIM